MFALGNMAKANLSSSDCIASVSTLSVIGTSLGVMAK